MLLSMDQIKKSFGVHLILDGVTAKVEDHDKIGLVGANGAGKSTLLDIIYGDLEADEGTLARSKATFGFLRQDSGLQSGLTIQEEMRGVFRELLEAEAEMRGLEQQIATMDAAHPGYHDLTARYAGLQAHFEQREGYHIDVRVNTVLNGMGFAGVNRSTPVDVLSGGEKTRLALCKLLLEEPGLLILDEPTNHLDFRTLLWLEEYLQGYKGALLVVSHDRYFLDKLCTGIWELEHKKLTAYPGNYSRYVTLKEERLERQWKEYEIQQAEIADLKDFVARNMARASTTARAKSKQKTLEKMDVVERPKPPPKPPKLRFSYKREPVKDVLHVTGLRLGVGQGQERKALLEGVDFDLMRGEKIALIGSNGVGKSTFLKALQNLVPADGGEIEWGRGVEISYFEQEELEMDAAKSALDELWDRFPQEFEHTIRTALGNVRLTGENVFKKVGDLSGGERARLKFAILLLKCGNVLLMDEPTNHLDLPAKEMLDSALGDYAGTLLVVSHDRYLLNQFPTKIAEMHPDGIRIYPGNYDSYLRQKNDVTAPREIVAEEKPQARDPYHRSKKQRSQQAARRREIESLEKTIEVLETEIFRLENEIADPATAGDYLILQEKCDILDQKRQELNHSLSRWTLLCEEQETL